MLNTQTLHSIIDQIIIQERLPGDFAEIATHFYLPLSSYIAKHCVGRSTPLIVGVNGAQGTGKSTLSLVLKQLLHAYELECVVISIDDLYLTREERARLANSVHPLLATRGVPGTHDLSLGLHLIAQLMQATSNSRIAIPAFDKALDDRSTSDHWRMHSGPVDVIVLEGWCVGALPTSLCGEPINALEAEHDADGAWRRFVEDQLREYQRLFAQIDLLIMLKAPSMECIIEWRTLQEQKLIAHLNATANPSNHKSSQNAPNKGIMNNTELIWFIMHYERLTRYMLATMPEHADVVFDLDAEHHIIAAHYRDPAQVSA